MKRRFFALLLTAAAVASPASWAYGQAGSEPAAAEREVFANAAVSDGFEPMVESDRGAIYANIQTTEVAFADKATGQLVYSTPRGVDEDENAAGQERIRLKSLVTAEFVEPKLNILEKVSSYTECVAEGSFRIAKSDTSIRITYIFKNYGIEIPVDVRLAGGGFTISVDTSKVAENGEFLLREFTLAPGMGAGHIDENGFIFVPDGVGGIIRFTDSTPTSPDYRGEIYGRDYNRETKVRPVAENTVRLPVFGIGRGGRGFLAVVSSGEGDGTVIAAPSNRASSYSTASCSFTVRNSEVFTMSAGSSSQETMLWEKGPLLPQKYTVTYIPLSGAEVTYVTMARAYKAYLEDNGGIKFAFDNRYPFVMNLYGGVQKQKHFLGFPYTGVQSLTSYDQARGMLQDAVGNGIDTVDVLYDCAFKESIRRKVMKSATPESGLGGKRGLAKLLDFAADSKGITIYPMVDYTVFRGAGMISAFFNGIKGISGLTVAQAAFDAVTGYADESADKTGLLQTAKISGSARRLHESLLKLDVTHAGINHSGTLTYSDMGGTRSRKSATAGQYAESFGLFGDQTLFIRDANAYALASASSITLPPSTPHLDIISESVPFFPIVISGMINYTVSPVNLDSMPTDAQLQAVEYGALLQYTFIAEPPEALRHTELENLYSCGYEKWIAAAAGSYKKVKEIYTRTGTHCIVGHSRPAEGVSRTDYENGTSVYVNYTGKAVEVNGVKISARSFELGEGGNR